MIQANWLRTRSVDYNFCVKPWNPRCLVIHRSHVRSRTQTAYKASTTNVNRLYGHSYTKTERQDYFFSVFYLFLFSSKAGKRVFLSDYKPTHFFEEKKLWIREKCIEMWMQGWHWSLFNLIPSLFITHCISFEKWPTCMRFASTTRKPYAGKLIVAISKDTALLWVELRTGVKVSWGQ